MQHQVRISPGGAQVLLKQCGWITLVLLGADIIFWATFPLCGGDRDADHATPPIAVCRLFTVAVLAVSVAGLVFLFRLGKLVAGMGRDPGWGWVVLTFYFGCGGFNPVPYVIAYYNIRRVVRKAFAPVPGAPPAPS
jgi:hypothetical protein